ncbi:hypothetical protein ACQCN2_11545 [Brevibacillus ginsengisoli]|uniref:hypothetical protein n=1 Tax=Brevibacillus ginsengisoli TaxID=363854 RepID=UPI003CF0D7E2
MNKLAALVLSICIVGSSTAAFAETTGGGKHDKMHTKAHHKVHTKAKTKPVHIKATNKATNVKMPKTGMGGTDE